MFHYLIINVKNFCNFFVTFINELLVPIFEEFCEKTKTNVTKEIFVTLIWNVANDEQQTDGALCIVHRALCTPHLLWSSWGIEAAGTHQEGVRLRFAILHIWIVTQHDVIKDSEELFVLTRLQLERHAG